MTFNRIVIVAVSAGALALLASCAAPGGGSQDVSAVLDKANRAMGGHGQQRA